MRFILLFISIALYAFAGHAQDDENSLYEKHDKFPSYFGLQIKPLIPTSLMGTKNLLLRQDNLIAEFEQKTGYSFGASVRVGITKLISIETGINFVQRKYHYNFSVPDSNLVAERDFRIISYDLPVNALFYIQLGKNFYMNASLGVAIVYNPTEIRTQVNLPGLNKFIQEGRRYSRFAFEANANVGFEYRTEKSGIIYLGISSRVPFKPIFKVAASYENQGMKTVAIGDINGSYLSLDLRYYLPNVKRKGPQFIPGPITQ